MSSLLWWYALSQGKPAPEGSDPWFGIWFVGALAVFVVAIYIGIKWPDRRL